MQMLPIVAKAMRLLPGSFINHNNELIMIPKFNVYTCLGDVETENDFKVKMCECFSRDCSYSLTYKMPKLHKEYYANNLAIFNKICGSSLTLEDIGEVYTRLGNCINRPLARKFVESGFDMNVLKE